MTITNLFVDAEVASHPQTKRIVRHLPLAPQHIEDPTALYRWINSASDPVKRGKQTLYLTRNKGKFLKPCPGTSDYRCCDYRILHTASFCTMDCSYCILQSYFHPPLLQFFVNREDLDKELTGLFEEGRIARVGTGEFTDSLIWEQWTDLTAYLVDRFSRQDRAVLELKTKTAAVDRLQELDHGRKTIVAWSLNTPSVMRSEERGTASLSARLHAAVRCQQWGYPLAFHFDPLVLYDGWEADYRDVVRRLFEHVDASLIAWISLGSFRFMPALKQIIADRFPTSTLPYGEFITGLDNKMRYFKPLRMELYRKMVAWIREEAPNVTVYFCMEDDEVWATALGKIPDKEGGVGRWLDQSAARVCNLNP